MIYLILLVIGFLSGMIVNFLSDLPYDKNDRYNYLLPGQWKLLSRARLVRTIICQSLCVISLPLLFLVMPTFYFLLISYLLFLFLIWVVVVDIEHQVIMFRISIFGFIFCLLAGTYLHGLYSSLLGGGVALVFQLIVFILGLVFKKVTSHTDSEGFEGDPFGFGDVTISAILGLILGWPYSIYAVMLSGLISGFYAWGVLIVSKFKGTSVKNMTGPHAPFIAVGVLTAYVIFCLGVI